MAQDRDQYVHFTIKLLKNSFTLGALWQDALKYHMVDQPDKLIALRLTEYYELITKGVLRPGPSVQGMPATPAPGTPATGGLSIMPAPDFPGNNPVSPQNPVPPSQAGARGQAPQSERADGYQSRIDMSSDIVVSASSASAEENAEEAADYWSIM